jgi:hypothetical protein
MWQHGFQLWLSLGNYGKQSGDEQIRSTESQYFVVYESNISSFLFWTWKTSHAVTFLPHFCIILYIVELGFVSLSRICLKYLLFWRYVTINRSRQTNIRSVQTSIRRKERNALMLMLWKRQCVPKHTSTLEYHVSDGVICDCKLMKGDLWFHINEGWFGIA